MSRIVPVCLSVLLCFWLVSSQTQDSAYWRLNFDQQASQHAYAASFHGVSEASHFLAARYWQMQQRAQALAYYQRAVEQGDAGAAYALAQHIPARHEQWLMAAAELGDPRATLTIAEQLRGSDPATAVALLEQLPAAEPRDQMLASLLFNHPHLSTASERQWQTLAPRTNSWQRRITQAQAFADDSGYRISADVQCVANITLYYHGDHARTSLYDWLDKLHQHAFAGLGLCFSEATVSATESFKCHQDAFGRAHCESDIDEQDTDFSVHVVSSGSANVRARQMAVAQTASFEVFIHELGHLFSLADEYSMRDELAQAFCSGRYRFSPLNLIITPKSWQHVSYGTLMTLRESLPWADFLQQPIAVPVPAQQGNTGYLLGSPSPSGVGLFKVDTCQGTDYQAWRPVAGTTFMQQHEVGAVPEVYIELIRRYLLQGVESSQR